MFKELKLEELKRKRRNYQALLEQVDKEIAKLEDELHDKLQYKEIAKLEDELHDKLQYKDYVKNKYCIVCANRIPEHDFKIPDSIVCGYPFNQEGKNKFQCTSHTCEHWKQEKNKT